MKQLLSFLVAVAAFAGSVSAQCAYNNTQTGVTLSPPTNVGVATQLSSCVSGGQFVRVSGLAVGATYTISTCGDTDFDSQITVYPAGGGSVIAYNDDFCGAQSSVTFVTTAANTSIDVLIDRYNCLSNSLCMTVNMTLDAAPAVDPCGQGQITALNCGVSQTYTLSGSGFGYNVTSCGFTTPGAEKIYSFTATATGAYTLNVTSATGGYVDYFIKDAAGGCSSSGWTCIDDINGAVSVPFNVVAGTSYYLLVDGEGTGSRTQTFNISCVAPPNPCNSIDSLSCGVSKTYTLSGAGGGWNVTSCGFSTPGAEQVYSFTAPTTGIYTLNVTSASGGYVDYFFKAASAGCGSTGWTCIDDVNASVSTNFTLTAGTYYLLVDGEDVGSKTQTFNITCPAPPPSNDGCGTPITVACGSSTAGSTLSATPDNAPSCAGLSVGTGGGVWYKFIGTGGLVNINTCDPATNYDTKLHVYEGSCTNLICVSADDDGCDSPTLASSVTFCSQQGTVYYVLVNGFLAATGNFVLHVDCTQPTLVIDAIADRCHDDASVTLTANIPGGVFTVNGVVATVFDPWIAPDGPSTITYSVCGLSTSITANVTATPANDLCSNATAIDCGDVISGSTVCATSDVAPICGTTDGTGGGVWYSFVGNGNSVTASLCNGSDYDTKIRVYTGTCGALSCQTGIDDFCDLQSEVSWCSEPGVTYYILVHGFLGEEGDFTLALTCNAVAPVITTCPGPQVGNLDATCGFEVPDYTGLVGSTDDCGVPTVAQFPAAGTILRGAGVNTLLFVVTDAGGNVDSCTTTLTLNDITLPTAICQSVSVSLDASGNGSINAEDVDFGSTDNCGIASISLDNSSFTCSNIGSGNTVTLTVTDGSGNSSTCSATVTVSDDLAPNAVCQNLTLNLDATGNVSISPEDLDGGSSDNCGIVSISASQTAFGCSNVGGNTVTFTVVDGSGNASSCTSTVTVVDDIAPTAVCRNVTLTLSSTGTGSVTAAQVDNGSSDNCGIATLSVSPSNFGCNNLGNNNVTLTVTDVNGNVSTCSAVVTVIEGHYVNINCPANITVSCETGEGGAYASWCAPTASAFNSCTAPCPTNTNIAGFSYIGEYNGHRYYVKNNGVNWNQANAGAQAIGGYLVTINNVAENTWLRNNLPSSCQGNTYWTGYNDVASEGNFAWANGEASSYTRWGSGEPNNDGGNNCSGSNNLSAGDYTVFQESDGKWYDRRGCNSYGYIVEINCGNAYTITQTGGPASGSLFPQGTTVITYTATDNYGTTATCSFTVTVEEVFEVLCPGDITIPCASNYGCGGNNSNQNGANVSWNAPTVIWETCAGQVCSNNTCINGFDYLGTYGGKRYYVSNSSVSWTSARNAALSAGGNLAAIDNAAENTWLNSQISGSSNYWIGLNDATTEGSFAWTDGATSTYRNWASNEPATGSSASSQDYVSFNASSGAWADRASGDCYKYIMEYSCNSYSVTQTAGPANGSFQAPGTYTVAYTATTTTGLVANCSFNITVEACPLNYCDIDGNSCYEWIRQVNLSNLDNWSGSNGGYEDFTQYSATVNRGSNYSINLRPGFSNNSRNEYWAVYIDWNQDGDFSDSGELEYTGNGTGVKTGTVSVPSGAATGNTRMRVIMRYGCAPSGPCSNVGNGEIEDYTITVTGAGVRAAAQANGQSDTEGGAESAAITNTDIAAGLMSVYPVPTQRELNLNYRSLGDGEVTVQVLALDGRIVMESKHQVNVSDNTIKLDVSSLPMASYQVKVTNGTETFIEKFVKQ